MRRTSDKGIALIQEHESCELTAYPDTGGVWTVGWGHTGADVKEGLVITQEMADGLLRNDLEEAERCVYIHCHGPLSQCQFDALVSFVFNLGCTQFRGSTLLRLLNAGNAILAKEQFKRWDKDNGVVLAGLVKRRAAEAELFGSGQVTA